MRYKGLTRGTVAWSLALVLSLTGVSGCKKSERESPSSVESLETPSSVGPASSKAQEAVSAKPADQENGVRGESVSAEKGAVRDNRHPVWRNYHAMDPQTGGLEQNPLLTLIPDTSFFVLASSGYFDWDRPEVIDFYQHISALVISEVSHGTASDAFEKAARAFMRGTFQSFSPKKLTSLGLSGRESNAHFVFYFSRNTPVLAISLQDMEKFRGIVDSYLTQNGVEVKEFNAHASEWRLISLGGASLAMHWGEDRLVLTLVSDENHANILLPDLLIPAKSGKSALEQLLKVHPSSRGMVAGVLDLHMLRNNFAAFEGNLERLFGRTERTDKRCVKDFGRLSKDIDRLSFEVVPVSGGSVMGVDARMRIHFSSPQPILSGYSSRRLVFPESEDMPLFQFWASISTEKIASMFEVWGEDLKRVPFTCPELKEFNSLPEEMSELLSHRAVVGSDHDMGMIVYSGDVESFFKATGAAPEFAFSYRSKDAARVGYELGAIQSASLEKHLEALEDPEPSSFVEHPRHYEDAMFSSWIEGGDRFALLVAPDSMTVAQTSELAQRVEKLPLEETASLLHIDVSERALGDAYKDSDTSRDFHLGFDMSSSPMSLDFTFRYVIE